MLPSDPSDPTISRSLGLGFFRSTIFFPRKNLHFSSSIDDSSTLDGGLNSWSCWDGDMIVSY